jgi:hypothetical protein
MKPDVGALTGFRGVTNTLTTQNDYRITVKMYSPKLQIMLIQTMAMI